MLTIRRILILATLLLLGACAPTDLWGQAFTPTPSPTLPVFSLPSPSPAPTFPPLIVLPQPGTPTPGMATKPQAVAAQPSATLPPVNAEGPMDVYQSQGGDTLQIVASRFGVEVNQIISDRILPPAENLLPYETTLLIPKTDSAQERSPGERQIPDTEVVFSPSASRFDTAAYLQNYDSTLATYKEYILSGGWTSGAQAVDRIAIENSLNPRIILAIIEYESRWVRGKPTNLAQDEYPLGHKDYHFRGLFRQLMWASGTLSEGYYGWRAGTLHTLTFRDGSTLRLHPNLNAGTAALQYYFAQTHERAEWQVIVSGDFAKLYQEMFGDPWQRAAAYEPSIPNDLRQPNLPLPFEPGKIWAFTGGPHSAWEQKGALAALDFAPGALESGCVKSDNWVLAPAPGVVVRTGTGIVVLDLDGDGSEQTGWNILFMHIATQGKAELGETLAADDKIGHPSCEGGVSTGTHVHIARKYNGEWMLAEGPLAFNLGGWVALNGEAPYKGSLTQGEKVIEACTCGSYETRIIRPKEE